MPVDFDFWRGASDEIQFSNVGTISTLDGGSSSSSSCSNSSTSSSACSYNTMLVRATASLLALCQLILDFITFRTASMLRDVRFSTQLCRETNNLSSYLKVFFPATVVRFHSQKKETERFLGHNTVHRQKREFFWKADG